MDAEIKHRNSDKTFKFVTPQQTRLLKCWMIFTGQILMSHMLQGERWFFKSILRLRNWRATSPRPSGMLWGWCCYSLRLPTTLDTRRFFMEVLTLAYVIGATANQAIFLAIHELSHNLLFRKPLHNKLFAVFANIPIGVPYSASFQPYHQLHHKFLGDMYLDTDLPTEYEGRFLSSMPGKLFLRYSRFSFMRWDRCLLLRSSLRMCI